MKKLFVTAIIAALAAPAYAGGSGGVSFSTGGTQSGSAATVSPYGGVAMFGTYGSANNSSGVYAKGGHVGGYSKGGTTNKAWGFTYGGIGGASSESYQKGGWKAFGSDFGKKRRR